MVEIGTSRRRTGLAVVAVLLLLTAACSSSDDRSAPAPPGAAGTSTAASPTAGPTAGPTHAPSDVAAARGRRERLGPLGITVPRSFGAGSDSGDDSFRIRQFSSADLSAYLEITRTQVTGVSDLDQAADYATSNSSIQPRRLPDRQVGGRPTYAVIGSDDFTAFYYAVGRVVDGALVEVSFSFRADTPDNQRLVEAVLASARWSS